MKLEKIGTLAMLEDEVVPDDYEPLCHHLGEFVYYRLKDVEQVNIQGFNAVTSYLYHENQALEARIAELEKIIEKVVGDLYEDA